MYELVYIKLQDMSKEQCFYVVVPNQDATSTRRDNLNQDPWILQAIPYDHSYYYYCYYTLLSMSNPISPQYLLVN